MTEVFADTSGWANGFVRTETFHAVAAAWVRRWQTDHHFEQAGLVRLLK